MQEPAKRRKDITGNIIKQIRPLSLIFSRKLSEAANENWFGIGVGQNVVDCTVMKMYEEHLETICR